ncbi:unnamed protein product [Nezara viridula]|uniref:Uncharacterized protein n=1 Tax=Nezara viridula TaxID=85310 RepID=A0A9P0H7Z9_NEZVI|nr:unnamed protein product [Nezara viridula]
MSNKSLPPNLLFFVRIVLEYRLQQIF